MLVVRREPRELCVYTVLFSILSDHTKRALHGIVYNLSPSGAGVITTHRIDPGQKILIEKGLESHLGKTAVAEVRWRIKVTDQLYKMGLCFTRLEKS